MDPRTSVTPVSGVVRTVYGIYYPETRRIVDALWTERTLSQRVKTGG